MAQAAANCPVWEQNFLHVEAAGFEIVDRYYRPPGLPIEQQFWLLTLLGVNTRGFFSQRVNLPK
jgi:hypothetical protein